MQPSPNPRRRLILAHWNTPPAVSTFAPTPPGYERLASVASPK
jgi:hypothetical protein